MKLTMNQAIVLQFLNRMNNWVSPTSIGVSLSRGHSAWASPICKALVKKGLVERNENGWYRAVRQ